MRHLRFALLPLAALVFSVTAQASKTSYLNCKKEFTGNSYQYYGELMEVTSTHPNGNQFSSFVLNLVGQPFCFVDFDSSLETQVGVTKSVQLNTSEMSKEALENIQANLGQTVSVTGDFYIGHTAWHIRSVVVQVQDIVFPE